ncbi:VOC family protein [Gordoniibacillus kamchatkensis]|uniref:VOC family protein n=1 Tax=Gordoniibacillus kamchatkensis TaxID=1590651 RepID=UPI000B11005D|nr:VOC family protein [Paenibacillus sp. VKM B-2647]
MAQHAKKRREAPRRKPQRGIEGYKPVVIPNAAKTLFGGIEMNDAEQKQAKRAGSSPIMNKVGSIFIPVRDIERAREWYCRLLGLPADCPIMDGHLCPLPMDGTGVILDTMPMWGGKEPGARRASALRPSCC